MSTISAAAPADTQRVVTNWVMALALLATVLCLQAFLPYSWIHEQLVGSPAPERSFEPMEIGDAQDPSGADEDEWNPPPWQPSPRRSTRVHMLHEDPRTDRPAHEPDAEAEAEAETPAPTEDAEPAPATGQPATTIAQVVVHNPQLPARRNDPTQLPDAQSGLRPQIPKSLPQQLEALMRRDPNRGLEHLLDLADGVWGDVTSVRATLMVRERRGNTMHPEERVSMLFHEPDCTLLHWRGTVDAGKTILHVPDRYFGMSLARRELETWQHEEVSEDDPAYLVDHMSLLPSELSFGARLKAIRDDLELPIYERPRVEYEGVQELRSSRRQAYGVALSELHGTRLYRRTLVWFDAENLMPVRIEVQKDGALTSLYEVRDVVLNPVDAQFKPPITAETFHRSRVFPGVWETVEHWDFHHLRLQQRLERLRGSR